MSKPICQTCVAGVQLFKRCPNLSTGHCAAVVQLFKWCRNLSNGTVLQGCSCLNGVEPICRHCVAEVQLFKRFRNLSAGTVLQRCSYLSGVEPICQHCVAEVQLFKRCRNISAGHCDAGVQLFKWCPNLSARTVLQGCSCLSGVKTYLLALCCRGAAVYVVLKPITRDCVAEVQLFKWCQNLSAGTVLYG